MRRTWRGWKRKFRPLTVPIVGIILLTVTVFVWSLSLKSPTERVLARLNCGTRVVELTQRPGFNKEIRVFGENKLLYTEHPDESILELDGCSEDFSFIGVWITKSSWIVAEKYTLRVLDCQGCQRELEKIK